MTFSRALSQADAVCDVAMSLSTGFSAVYQGLKFTGFSIAGITTSIAMPEFDLCFDVAQGLPYQIPFNTILITHGHMDHASGLPYLLAMKSMMGQAVPNVHMPESLIEPMTKIMAIWAEIDQHEYRFNFIPVKNNESVPLKGSLSFRAFPTLHRVPSHGYTIFERKKRLKEEYRTVTPHELGVLRKQGTVLDEHREEPLVSFTGDTKIEFLDSEIARKSKVLIMEVTYWDQKKSVSNAREWGHIHFDELLSQLDRIESEKIVLIHASARYTTPYLNEILKSRIPDRHQERVILFPRPM